MKTNHETNWSEGERLVATRLRALGLNSARIAEQLGRSREAIRAKLARLEVEDRKVWHPLRDNVRLLTLLQR